MSEFNLQKIFWHSRRGMLELDLLLVPFATEVFATLSHPDQVLYAELLEEEDNPEAQPYLWPIAHDVRPAAQSLGIRYCTDCHGTDAPFFFGDVGVDSPVVTERDSVRKMIEFQDIAPFYAWAFAFSFVFRPWMKMIVLGSCAVMAVVLLLYALKALACVVKALAGENL